MPLTLHSQVCKRFLYLEDMANDALGILVIAHNPIRASAIENGAPGGILERGLAPGRVSSGAVSRLPRLGVVLKPHVNLDPLNKALKMMPIVPAGESICLQR
jgi:hypothetical protein